MCSSDLLDFGVPHWKSAGSACARRRFQAPVDFPCLLVSMSFTENSVSDSDFDFSEPLRCWSQLASDPDSDTPSSLHNQEQIIRGLLFGSL